MYKVVKMLNNNGVLAYDMDNRREVIFLGHGIGFGKRPGELFKGIPEAKLYTLTNRRQELPLIKVVNGINPIYLEATGKLLELAEKRFGHIHNDILLPLADHIALAAKRMQEGRELPNPFTADIRILFPEEFQTAAEGASLLRQMTGVAVSEDEIGYITLHIHSALSDEDVAQSLDLARLTRKCIRIIEEGMGSQLKESSLGYSRLMSHIRYMLARIRSKEKIPLDVEDYVKEQFPKAYALADQVCRQMEAELRLPAPIEENGFLGLHIQRVWNGEG